MVDQKTELEPMKFSISCSLKALVEALKFANSFVQSRPSHPVLCGVLLKAKDNSLTLETTDLRHGCKITIPATVNIANSTIIPCKELLALLTNFVGDTIDIFLTESARNESSTLLGGSTNDYDYLAVAQLGSQQAFLATFHPNEFPDIQSIKPDHTVNLSAEQLVAAIERSSYTVSRDDTKQVLCGVNLQSKPDGLYFAGTNGHYLGITTIDGNFDPSLSVTIPVIFFSRLQKLLKDVDTVIIEMNDSSVQASITAVLAKEVIVDVCLYTRILEGTYPAYNRLIPTDFSREVKVSREGLVQALGLIGVCITESVNTNESCVVDIKEDEILVSKSGAAIKTVSQVVKSELLIGEPIIIGLNHNYFKNILTSLSSDQVIIYLNETGNPVIIKGVDEPLETTALLMPVQLR